MGHGQHYTRFILTDDEQHDASAQRDSSKSQWRQNFHQGTRQVLLPPPLWFVLDGLHVIFRLSAVLFLLGVERVKVHDFPELEAISFFFLARLAHQ